MEALAELRRTTRASRCQECGKCTTMCPLAASGDFSARLIACQDSEKAVYDRPAAVQRCLTCALCEMRCPQEIRFTEFVRGVRALIPPAARWPCPHGQVLLSATRMMASSNMPARETDWVGGGLKVAEEGEIALFVGCLPLFDVVFQEELGVEMMEIARSAIRLLNHVGIEPVLVPRERCCGHDLLWSGDREAFLALANANAAAFAERGVRRVLTTCAECCRTWRLDYAEAVPDYRPRVEHFVEFLAERIACREFAFPGNGVSTVTYQDPCRLGRHLGIYDPPRQVLAAMPGTTAVEMDRSGPDAVCCGTAGFIHCDAASRRLQAERLRSAAETGAETLLTACPKCLIHFVCAQAEDRRTNGGSPSVEVQDLTVFAAMMLGVAERTKAKAGPSKPGPGQADPGDKDSAGTDRGGSG